jgi:putative ABC transport system ATP-binding protein
MCVIKTKDLTKTFRQGEEVVVAVNRASIAVNRGEFVAIVGQSGSGKTTLLNMIACIDKATSGTIVIDGVNASEVRDNELARIRRRKIGYIYQNFNLIPILSAAENIMIPALLDGKKPDMNRLGELAELLEIGNRLNHLPSELSGGQKQRVAIARALINSPSLILADEPTGNLDKRTADEIIRLLLEMNQRGHTLLLVTHEQRYADMAKRKLVIEDGVVGLNMPP